MAIENDSTTSINEDLDLLNQEAPIIDPPEVKVPETEEEEVQDPDSSLEEELEEPELEPEASAPLHDRPTVAQIKEKFPTLFKEFPALRDMYFREREYTEIYPTVADAKEASENSEAFTTIRDGVLAGDMTKFFQAAQEVGSLDKIASALLPNLHKLSPDLHWKASLPFSEGLAKAMYADGINSGDENLQNAALVLSKFLFNDTSVAQGKRTFIEKQEGPKVSEAEKRVSEIEAREFMNFRGSVEEVSSSGLRDLINERGQHNKLKIDPDGVMSPFLKNAITQKIIDEVGTKLESDKSHLAHMNTLWKKARESGYTGDWKSRISSAFLERAKSLVPSIRSRLVAEALGTSAAVNNGRVAKLEKQSTRREPGSGRPSGSEANKPIDPKKVDWRNTSDMDILNGTAKFKK